MAKFTIGVIVGLFFGSATSACSAGVAVGWEEEPPAFLSGPLETQHLRHPALAIPQRSRPVADRLCAQAIILATDRLRRQPRGS